MNQDLLQNYGDEAVFIEEILKSPDSVEARLVYADWLEERGDERSEFIRADLAMRESKSGTPEFAEHQHRRRKLSRKLRFGWVSLISRSEIERCDADVKFDVECPLKFESLIPVDGNKTVRYCNQCVSNVYYCDSVGTARNHARYGRCVAIDAGAVRSANDLGDAPIDLLMGRIDISDASAEPESTSIWSKVWNRSR